MKRKVVHLVYSLGFGGLEQVIVNLINNSTQYNVQHHVITLIGNHDLYDMIEPDVQIYNLKKKPGKDLGIHWKLYILLRQIDTDVIHTYNFGTIEYHAVAALAGVKRRIHCEHGRGGDDPDGMNFWHNVVRRFSILFIHHFIVVSPDLMEWGKKILKLKNDKLKLVLNGVDLDKYFPSKEKNEGYTICTVGRASPVKNQKLLIDVFYLLNQRYSEFISCKLVIVGDGPIFNELKAQIARLNMENQILLLGYRKEIADIMRKSNLFVLSSVYEAMPMTILEAMACQIPVIATNVGGVRHMISENEAWLVESNNVEQLAKTIFNAYSNEKLSHEKASNGRELVSDKYSLEKMVSDYMFLYDCNVTVVDSI